MQARMHPPFGKEAPTDAPIKVATLHIPWKLAMIGRPYWRSTSAAWAFMELTETFEPSAATRVMVRGMIGMPDLTRGAAREPHPDPTDARGVFRTGPTVSQH